MAQVWICSPIPAMRAGLSAIISADPDLQVLGWSANAGELPPGMDADWVVVATPGGVDLAALGLPARAALLLVGAGLDEFFSETGPASLADVVESLEGRAWGLVLPESASEALQAAARALAEGLAVLPPEALAGMLNGGEAGQKAPGATPNAVLPPDADGASPEHLTEREVEVLRLLSQGLTNKQAALALRISEHTVKFHVSSIYTKLGVTNRAEAVRIGARRGWIAL